MKRLSALAIPTLIMVAGSAGAQTSPTAATTAAATTTTTTTTTRKGFDPNKVVCHTESVTGSLLATTRECHTNAEWAESQRQQRSDLSRAQAQGGR